jgi:hypothetical protein
MPCQRHRDGPVLSPLARLAPPYQRRAAAGQHGAAASQRRAAPVRRCAPARARPLRHSCSVKMILIIHFVLWTPGVAGMIGCAG